MKDPVSNNNRPKLVILAGPTAVGKSELSIRLAQAIGGEIISADSMQVYRYMDIGSAKITSAEMGQIPHFMVDELEPYQEFNVTLFQKKAKSYMEEIYKRGNIPILVGGTGFYIQAVLYDIDFEENEGGSVIRSRLELLADREGSGYLHRKLEEVDPVSARLIHPNNVKRVIRALEYYQATGKPISVHNEAARQKVSPYHSFYFVLNDERSRLYERIDQRVDRMIEAGLVNEVKKLKEMGYNRSFVSMQGLGYKEIFAFLEGEITREEAIYRIKRDTRHFAKRQLTWFRREKNVIWLNKPEFAYDDEEILKRMIGVITGV